MKLTRAELERCLDEVDWAAKDLARQFLGVERMYKPLLKLVEILGSTEFQAMFVEPGTSDQSGSSEREL